MPRELILRTPENVEITHNLAGLGSRFVALTIDHLIQGLIAFLSLILFFGGFGALASLLTSEAAPEAPLNLASWMIGLIIAFYFMLFWGYFILFETFWNGQTPGKRLMNLRVVKENGRPIDFFSSSARNLVRIIDYLPGMYGVGAVTMFFSPSYKRVGDYVAGTLVVKEYREEKPRERNSPAPNQASSPGAVSGYGTPESDGGFPETPEEVPGVTVSGIGRVTREEYDAARRDLDRRDSLPPHLAGDLSRRLAEPILHRLDMTPADPERYPYDLFLETLARDYIRWQEVRH